MIFEFWIFLLFRDGETQIVLQGGNIIFLIFYEKMPSRDLLQKKNLKRKVFSISIEIIIFKISLNYFELWQIK